MYKNNVKISSIKDFYTSGLGSDNSKLLSSDDSKSVIFFNKAERLRVAFVLLAQNLDDDLRSELILLANSFIYTVIDAINGELAYGKYKNKLKSATLKFAELLDLYVLSSYLSENNAKILKDALISFNNFIENEDPVSVSKVHAFTESDFLSITLDDFLPTEDGTVNHKGHHKGQDLSYKGHIKDIYKKHKGHTTSDSKLESSAGKTNSGISTFTRSTSLRKQASSQSRRLQILELLKTQDTLTLPQIMEKLSGKWSKKTIQRELNKMCEESIVEKIGDKRWTSYRILVN